MNRVLSIQPKHIMEKWVLSTQVLEFSVETRGEKRKTRTEEPNLIGST